MNKTQKYAVTIMVLLIANLVLFFGDNLIGFKEADTSYFDFSDGQIEAIQIENSIDSVLLERVEQNWILNGQFEADLSFVNILLSVLDRLEEGRNLKEWKQGPSGRIILRWENGKMDEVGYAVNPNRTKTYFISGDEIVQVAVPGYRDNVAGIFELHSDQWRDRLVFDGSWRTIQKVNVENGGESFEIKFSNDFFLLDGENPNDSSAVIDYLNQFQQFQANEMISVGRFKGLDSLSKLKPLAKITLDDIKQELPITFRIYPNEASENYHLVIDSQERWMVIDARRIQQLLSLPQ